MMGYSCPWYERETDFITQSIVNPFKCEQYGKFILSSSCADLMQYFNEPNLTYSTNSIPNLSSDLCGIRKKKGGYQSSNHTPSGCVNTVLKMVG